jgi:uncharacterized protein
MPTLTLDHLRRHAVARSLFKPTTLGRAIKKLGFVQADPIRAPARAQDLTLRHRVAGYRAGELEARYPQLALEEDFFVNYGYLPRTVWQLLHPRSGLTPLTAERARQAASVLAFVRERGAVHPREVDEAFAHGKSRTWFGGTTNASTQLLDAMHYRGLLRIKRRDAGVRVYAPAPEHADCTDPAAAYDTVADVVIDKYSPLPERTLSELVLRLRHGAPQWAGIRSAAVQRARARHAGATIDGTRWYWPAGENPSSRRWQFDDTMRLLAPFDPVVWDRRRFEVLWGWAYRFEAYTPAPKRVRGHYALPLLWRGHVVGWGNLKLTAGVLEADLGFVAGRPPQDAAWHAERDAELSRMAVFLGLDGNAFRVV